MPAFWYPYDGFQDARNRLCLFADRAVGPFCGVSFSDGDRLSVLRHPASPPNGQRLWLNVLVQHISAPPPLPARSSGLLGSLKGWFWKAMEIEGQAEIQSAQAQLAASQAVGREFRDQVWEPTHEFLIRHKFAADTAGLALDVVGVMAGVLFLIVAAPELAAAGTLAASAALATGTSAFLGSVVLLGTDGTIYGAAMLGHEAFAAKLEDNSTVQWMRIGASVMLLPDLAVGSVRTLQEIAKLGTEARTLSAGTDTSRELAAAARDRVNEIRNPLRHPGPVNRRLHKVRMLERQAMTQRLAADACMQKVGLMAVRDLGLFQGSTLAGTGLMTAAPPANLLTPAQRQKDELYQKGLVPEGGFPPDVKLQVRVISLSGTRSP